MYHHQIFTSKEGVLANSVRVRTLDILLLFFSYEGLTDLNRAPPQFSTLATSRWCILSEATSDIPVNVNHCLLFTIKIRKLLQIPSNLLLLLLILAAKKLKAVMVPCHFWFFAWTFPGHWTKPGCTSSTVFLLTEVFGISFASFDSFRDTPGQLWFIPV